MGKEEDSGESESSPKFLLPRFNTLYDLIKLQIDHRDGNKARDTYHRMLTLYNSINSEKSLSAGEKKDAYSRLTEVFSDLSNTSFEARSGIMPFARYIFPISVIVIILIIIFFVRPEFTFTGLFAADGMNSAPVWVGGDAEFRIRGKTEINLDSYFADPDGDDITYVATNAPGISIGITNNILTVHPSPELKGTRVITIAASDLNAGTRVSTVLYIE